MKKIPSSSIALTFCITTLLTAKTTCFAGKCASDSKGCSYAGSSNCKNANSVIVIGETTGEGVGNQQNLFQKCAGNSVTFMDCSNADKLAGTAKPCPQ